MISLFSLKIDFNYPLLILRFDFWCVATAGRRSWQVVREAKNAVSVAVKKLKLPWVKLKLISVSKIEIAVTLLGHHNGEIDYSFKIFRRFLLAPSAKSS